MTTIEWANEISLPRGKAREIPLMIPSIGRHNYTDTNGHYRGLFRCNPLTPPSAQPAASQPATELSSHREGDGREATNVVKSN